MVVCREVDVEQSSHKKGEKKKTKVKLAKEFVSTLFHNGDWFLTPTYLNYRCRTESWFSDKIFIQAVLEMLCISSGL